MTTNHTCQHCGFSGDRDFFPNTVTICKNCVRDRPIAWKATLYNAITLCQDHSNIPECLKEIPGIRGKNAHPLQNLSKLATRSLMETLKFDEILYPIWSQKKKESQDNKGGAGAYADVARTHLFAFMKQETDKGNLVLKNINEFITNTTPKPSSDCCWKDSTNATPLSETGDNLESVVPLNESNHTANTLCSWPSMENHTFVPNPWEQKYHALKRDQRQKDDLIIEQEARIELLNRIINNIVSSVQTN